MAKSSKFIAVHPVVGSHDVDRSLQFYSLLGFKEVFRDQAEHPRYAAAVRDGVELHFQWNDSEAPAGVDKPVFRIFVDGVDELFTEFMRSGALKLDAANSSPWASPGDTPWGTREFHVRDPFGNGLQFYCDRKADS